MCDQIRRAGLSVMGNIAEGFERNGRGEFIRSIANGCVGEVRCYRYVARDQGYVSDPKFGSMINSAEEVARMMSGLIGHLRESRITGAKYRSVKAS